MKNMSASQAISINPDLARQALFMFVVGLYAFAASTAIVLAAGA